jgi:hypothetical protein
MVTSSMDRSAGSATSGQSFLPVQARVGALGRKIGTAGLNCYLLEFFVFTQFGPVRRAQVGETFALN